jgi:hypothetical protein
VLAALLMTACSQNETELNTASQEPVAISFSFTSTQDNQATTRGDAEDAQLRNTGFGVFATVGTSAFPNLMYNQEVTYTYLADDNYTGDVAQNGYWSYSPVKFWPMTVNGAGETVPQNVTFCAYAPYVAAGGATGITGVSANNEAPYLDYTLAEDLDETVDLLWNSCVPSVRGPIKFDMYHALARVAVNVKLNDANTYKTATTKVLISQITLSTSTAAKTGRLKLDDDNTETISAVTCHYPTWTNQTTGDRTVDILNIDNSDSYGIIAEEIRYIDDLPYSWQPEGLQKGVASNALCTGDYPQAYIYFIPNEADGLTLNCKVYYTLMDEAGNKYTGCKTRTDPVVITPLRGNRTYQLNLEIDPTP